LRAAGGRQYTQVGGHHAVTAIGGGEGVVVSTTTGLIAATQQDAVARTNTGRLTAARIR
jgi:L-lactate utilization protein LutB